MISSLLVISHEFLQLISISGKFQFTNCIALQEMEDKDNLSTNINYSGWFFFKTDNVLMPLSIVLSLLFYCLFSFGMNRALNVTVTVYITFFQYLVLSGRGNHVLVLMISSLYFIWRKTPKCHRLPCTDMFDQKLCTSKQNDKQCQKHKIYLYKQRIKTDFLQIIFTQIL